MHYKVNESTNKCELFIKIGDLRCNFVIFYNDKIWLNVYSSVIFLVLTIKNKVYVTRNVEFVQSGYIFTIKENHMFRFVIITFT